MTAANYSLKEDIRQYWSDRAATFDLAFGHRIPPGPEFDAWRQAIVDHLGTRPLRVLELACGTGEVTGLLLSLGHNVTAIDFSETMLSVARGKHGTSAHFLLADAENTRLPDSGFDAIVCRHLVWTLTTPQEALREWHRLLKPDGQILIFDGDWARPKPVGKIAARLIALLDHVIGADPNYDGAMGSRHADIMTRPSLRGWIDRGAADPAAAEGRLRRHDRFVTSPHRPGAAPTGQSAQYAPNVRLSTIHSPRLQDLTPAGSDKMCCVDAK